MTTDAQWTCELDEWIEHRPIVDADTLVVRSGGRLVCVGSDGVVRWSTAVDPNNNTGQFLLASGDVVVGSRNVEDRTVLVAVDRSGELAWEAATGVIVVDAVAATDTEVVAFGGVGDTQSFLRFDSASGAVSTHDVPWLPDRIAIDDTGIIGTKRDVPGLVRFDAHGVATHHFSSDPVYGLAATSQHIAITALVEDETRLRLLSPSLEPRWERAATSTIVAADGTAVACTARSDSSAVELVQPETGNSLWVSDRLADEFVSFAVFDEIVAARGLTRLWALDRRTGAVLSEHLMGAALVATPGAYYVAAMKTLTRYSSDSP